MIYKEWRDSMDSAEGGVVYCPQIVTGFVLCKPNHHFLSYGWLSGGDGVPGDAEGDVILRETPGG
jgi:hypothetical protein